MEPECWSDSSWTVAPIRLVRFNLSAVAPPGQGYVAGPVAAELDERLAGGAHRLHRSLLPRSWEGPAARCAAVLPGERNREAHAGCLRLQDDRVQVLSPVRRIPRHLQTRFVRNTGDRVRRRMAKRILRAMGSLLMSEIRRSGAWHLEQRVAPRPCRCRTPSRHPGCALLTLATVAVGP
jgi:hypothetical protein